jgi:hypothetical protein
MVEIDALDSEKRILKTFIDKTADIRHVVRRARLSFGYAIDISVLKKGTCLLDQGAVIILRHLF